MSRRIKVRKRPHKAWEWDQTSTPRALDKTIFDFSATGSIEVFVYGYERECEIERNITDYPLHVLSPAMYLYATKPMTTIGSRFLPCMRVPRWARSFIHTFGAKLPEVKVWALCDALANTGDARDEIAARMESLLRLGADYPTVFEQLGVNRPTIDPEYMAARRKEMLSAVLTQLKDLGYYEKRHTEWRQSK